MTVVLAMLAVLFAAGTVAGAIHTARKSVAFELATPPLGTLVTLNGAQVHYLVRNQGQAEPRGDLPLLFIHGAGGNLRDPLLAFDGGRLSEHRRTIYVDRPGQGYSDPVANNHDPRQQAAQIVRLMDYLAVERAVIIGHSFGAAVAAALAVDHPDRVASLVLISPASHPWPGGVAWYYHAVATPLLGWWMTNTIIVPIGETEIPNSLGRAFAPGAPPATYAEEIGATLALRPHAFRANAADIAKLIDHVRSFQARYREISVPVEIVTGDADQTVLWTIHSSGLKRDIDGANLTIIRDAGHMPHHSDRDQVIDAIERAIRRADQASSS